MLWGTSRRKSSRKWLLIKARVKMVGRLLAKILMMMRKKKRRLRQMMQAMTMPMIWMIGSSKGERC